MSLSTNTSANPPSSPIDADDIRAYAVAHFVEPARRAGKRRFDIPVRPIAQELGKLGLINHVCAALRSARRFQQPNGLRLIATAGPPSGVSTTVVYTFEFVERLPAPNENGRFEALLRLRGAARDQIAAEGGADALWRSIREGWES